MMNFMKKFLADEEGASAVEYGVIVALIAIALIVIFTTVFPTVIEGLFQTVSDSVDQVGQD